MQITPYQAKYNAYALTSRQGADGVGNISQSLFDACVDLNPHQVDAALFACQNPLSQGVILADEVGLGKTIEAGLVISQRWAERRRRILIIVPANLRKQWHQELQEKFALECLLLEAKNYNAMRKQQTRNPFDSIDKPVICSYQFAKSKPDFVAERDEAIFMVETKARDDLSSTEVQAKAAAASRWCRHASEHSAKVGSKPWRYLLIPHDEVVESKQWPDYLRYEMRS